MAGDENNAWEMETTQMSRASNVLCITGCVLLFVTALFHGTGYPGVSHTVSQSDHPAMLKAALPGMWLHFSVHLIVLIAFGLFASFSKCRSRSLLSLLTIAVAADAVLVFYFVGFFAGVALLAAASVCFAVSALLQAKPGLRDSGA